MSQYLEFLRYSTFNEDMLLWASGHEYWLLNSMSLSAVRSLVVQWVKCWPTDLAVVSLCTARGEIFSTKNGIPLHTTFHYQPLIILILQKYCWKGHKIVSHPFISVLLIRVSEGAEERKPYSAWARSGKFSTYYYCLLPMLNGQLNKSEMILKGL